MVSEITHSHRYNAPDRRVAVGCTVAAGACVWVDTYETVCGACVRDGVEDGAEGGWYLVGGREIRAGKRGSSNSLRARSNREEAGERQEGGEPARVREGQSN